MHVWSPLDTCWQSGCEQLKSNIEDQVVQSQLMWVAMSIFFKETNSVPPCVLRHEIMGCVEK